METTKIIEVSAISDGSERKFGEKGNDSYWAKSRVFVDFGEDVWTHLENRRSRDYTTLKPIVLEALRAKGINATKLSWNRYAGCSMCPCSGGFMIEGEDGKDYWAKIETTEIGKELMSTFA